MESILLYAVLTKHLRLLDAVLLSLSMNAVSLAVGWLLPV
jgi:hypothetical protein